MSYQQNNGTPSTQTDTTTELVVVLLKAVSFVVFLPLAIPLFTWTLIGPKRATRASFWRVPKWWGPVAAGGVTVWAGVVIFEVVVLALWVQDDGLARLREQDAWLSIAWGQVWPWLIVNFLLGFLLVPLVVSWKRRQLRRLTRLRRIPNVTLQEDIERAQTAAADSAAGERAGVRVNREDGTVTALAKPAARAPLELPDGRHAIAVRTTDTVRNAAERFDDVRRLPDWLSKDGRYVCLPDKPAAARVLVIAESGSGKTVLLNDAIAAALAKGWRVFFLDAKGALDDAEHVAGIARRLGRTANVGGAYNLFSGTPAQIVGKLMRLWPSSGGDGEHYRSEAISCLHAIQAESPLVSVDDLFKRLLRPTAFVGAEEAAVVLYEPEKGMTSGQRVWQSLSARLVDIRPYLSEDGWTFANAPADLTVIPLVPVDPAEKKLGDLMMHDLRNYVADRLRQRITTPMLVVVDEFPQLTGEDIDAGDSAAQLFETCRTADMGLILAAQSTAGLSSDEVTRKRLLSSGVALVAGRTKDPDEVVNLAGTTIRMESSGGSGGDELRSGRAQHTFVLPPGHLRNASIGAFWMIQAGAVAAFRALMPVEPLYETPEADDSDAAAEAAQVGAELAQPATGAQASPARPGEPA